MPPQVQNFETKSSSPWVKSMIIVIVVLVLIIAAGGGWYWFSQKQSGNSTTALKVSGPYGGEAARIGDTNVAYTQAVAARKVGNIDLARSKYDEAYAAASSAVEKAQIREEQGSMLLLAGRVADGVAILKALIADDSAPKLQRAYAVQALGQGFYSGTNGVYQAIFTGSPYESFVVSGDTETTLKNLFEYGSSFYPLSYAELRIANWYAKELLLRKQGKSKETTPSAEELTQKIRQNIANADADIEHIKVTYPGDFRISESLLLKVFIAGRLYFAGDTTTVPNLKGLFQEALQTARITGNTLIEAYLLYRQATFLAYTDPKQNAAQIQQILANFYESDRFAQTAFVTFLTNEKTNQLGAKSDIELLASIDPKFKQYLVTLGWAF